MKRQLQGLSDAVRETDTTVADGVYLARIENARYRWHAQKPFYLLQLAILEPQTSAGQSVTSRLYCTSKAMWKLGWFLRDFLYDPELLSQSEVDEQALRGLVGVVKISHTVVNGIHMVNFDGFAPASQWEELSSSGATPPKVTPLRTRVSNLAAKTTSR